MIELYNINTIKKNLHCNTKILRKSLYTLRNGRRLDLSALTLSLLPSLSLLLHRVFYLSYLHRVFLNDQKDQKCINTLRVIIVIVLEIHKHLILKREQP